MHLFSILLMAVASNLDNLCVGLLMGVQRKRITGAQNLWIALLSGLTTWICCQAASYLQGMGRLSALIGGVLLIGVGLQSLWPKKGEPAVCQEAGKIRAQAMSTREGMLLGWALAINCIPIAFGAGMTGIPAGPAAVGIALFSFLCVGLGSWLGVRLGARMRTDWFARVAGGLMIVLGVLEFFI